MTVYSFYIFDRHTECIYQRRWTPPPTSATKRPASTASPSRLPSTHQLPSSAVSSPPQSAASSRPQSRSQQSRPQSASSTLHQTSTTETSVNAVGNSTSAEPHQQYPTSIVTSKTANDAKLLFGVIFSLRNLTRQLGGSLNSQSSSSSNNHHQHNSNTANNNSTSTSTSSSSPQPAQQQQSTSQPIPSSTSSDPSNPSSSSISNSQQQQQQNNQLPHPNTTADEFLSYTTAEYKLHYYETATNLKFCMLTDPRTANLRIVLHQIWANLWVEYVVRNPLSPVEFGSRAADATFPSSSSSSAATSNGAVATSRPGRQRLGVGNELFEMGLDRFVAQVVNPV